MTDSKQVEQFIKEQFADWKVAADNYAALAGVTVKDFDVDGMNVKVQFNPARILSSGAKVDKESIKARKCFLCDENRPAEQISLPWGENYTILVNPFPIFPRHLTIPDKRHVDQAIKGRIADMIKLASELEDYVVFYNGPKCGASAPDHMHFQAGNRDFLPLEENVANAEHKVIIQEGENYLSLVDTYPLKFFVIDAETPEAGNELFNKLYDKLPVPEGETEPMLNVLAYSTAAGVRIVVIPRKRHRPSFYGMDDDSMVLSPASVDLGGVFITPRKQDFDKLDAKIVRKVYNELCYSDSEIEEIAEKLS